MNRNLPELLSPAGSFEALRAAIDGGADAVYMGGASFNARINAKNFTEDDMRDAISLAHAYGVKLYQTVNTMIFDRERDDFLRAAEVSAKSGISGHIGIECIYNLKRGMNRVEVVKKIQNLENVVYAVETH